MDPSASFELEPRTKTIDVHPDSKETKKVILINSIAIDPLSTCKGMQKERFDGNSLYGIYRKALKFAQIFQGRFEKRKSERGAKGMVLVVLARAVI